MFFFIYIICKHVHYCTSTNILHCHIQQQVDHKVFIRYFINFFLDSVNKDLHLISDSLYHIVFVGNLNIDKIVNQYNPIFWDGCAVELRILNFYLVFKKFET